MSKEMQEMFRKVEKADKDKTKHKSQAENLKKDIANDDREGFIAKGRILDYICKTKNITLEALCEYLMNMEVHPRTIRRAPAESERNETNE